MQTIKEIVEELCAENNNAQFPSEITATDVLPYVDTAVVCEWAARAVNTSTYPTLVCEALDLTEGDAARFLATILNDSHTARDIAAQAVRLHVAKVIARQANDANENMDEAPRGSYASWVDDPVRSDRRAIGRAR